MSTTLNISIFVLSFLLIFSFQILNPLPARGIEDRTALDRQVQKFLEDHKGQWHDWNVPSADGKVLYDIIVENNYQRAVEIGTSTGHSAIWIAWALSKTGGKLITIEIDESRYRQALANFQEAGLSDYIDARLADAHKLVYELEGPFDFVFSDADKDWYKRYFMALAPKLEARGCFAAHNAFMRGRGIREYLDYVKSLNNFETTIDRSSGSGIAISYKTSE